VSTAIPGSAPQQHVTRAELMRVSRLIPAGVSVVAARGDPLTHAMTASSVTWVSQDPPMLLVCVSRETRMHGALTAAEGFSVSLLSHRQAHVSRHFASRSRPTGQDQFNFLEWRPAPRSGSPLIVGALATIDCLRHAVHPAGDHTIVVGHVVAVDAAQDDGPLIYFDRAYHRLAPPMSA